MFHVTWKSWSQFCVVPAPGVGWECVKLLWRSAATARLNYLFAFSVSKLYTFVDGETPASCYKMAILHSVLKCSTSVFLEYCDSLFLSPFFSLSLSLTRSLLMKDWGAVYSKSEDTYPKWKISNLVDKCKFRDYRELDVICVEGGVRVLVWVPGICWHQRLCLYTKQT